MIPTVDDYIPKEESTRTGEDSRTSSVSLKTNAKGQVQWEVKLYFDKDKETNEDVVKRVKDLTDQLNAKYNGDEQ